MNYSSFKEQLLACFILEAPIEIDEDDMHEYYVDFREQTMYHTVREWAQFHFIDFTLDDHGYQLINELL